MKYGLVYADPPWSFRDKCHAGERGAEYKYPCMSLAEICALPVADIAAPNSLLAMWWVDTMPEAALAVCRAWGFKPFKMNGLVWEKTTKHGKRAFGMGNISRPDAEACMFGVRGKVRQIVVDRSVRQSFCAPVGRHSEKPQEAADRLVQLVGDVPRVELFARAQRDGWDVWGNEVDGVDVFAAPLAPGSRYMAPITQRASA